MQHTVAQHTDGLTDAAAKAIVEIVEIVGPGPLAVARTRAEKAGVVFGQDVRRTTPHMSSSAVFVVLMDGQTLGVRRVELEALHMAAVVAERGHRARLDVAPCL